VRRIIRKTLPTPAFVVASIALGAVLTIPAIAEAAPYLSNGEACRVSGRAIHREYTNVVPGSGRCYVQRHPRRRNIVMTGTHYRDRSGQRWYTSIMVRETWDSYYTRILSDTRD
jgi:hypothetical protein